MKERDTLETLTRQLDREPEKVRTALECIGAMRRAQVRKGAQHPIVSALGSLRESTQTILKQRYSRELHAAVEPLLNPEEGLDATELREVLWCFESQSPAIFMALLRCVEQLNVVEGFFNFHRYPSLNMVAQCDRSYFGRLCALKFPELGTT